MLPCVTIGNKKIWIDPKTIEIDDNSEPEDNLDCIPPSPIPDEITYTGSTLETRSECKLACIFYQSYLFGAAKMFECSLSSWKKLLLAAISSL